MNVNPPRTDSFISVPGTKPRTQPTLDRKPTAALPGTPSLGQGLRGHGVAFLGEFVGTFLFMFFAFAGTRIANEVASTTLSNGPSLPNTGNLLYIALAFGFSLAVNAWVFFRISGGLFNPAVSLALALVGCISYSRMVIAMLAQFLGAIAAAAVVRALFPSTASFATYLHPGISVTRGVVIEMFLTTFLIITIFMLAAEKHRATFLAPVGIGLALFVAELAGVWWTGGSLNPARSFAPAVVFGSFPGHHWIYWVGPLLGSLLAVIFYRFIKALEYETYGAAGQDADHADPTGPADPYPRRGRADGAGGVLGKNETVV